LAFFWVGPHVISVNDSHCTNQTQKRPWDPTQNPGAGELFWFMLAFGTCVQFFYSAVRVISDTATLNHLGDHRKVHYGKQRLWGSIGYSLFAFISTFIVHRTCDLFTIFYTFAGCTFVLCFSLIPFQVKAKQSGRVTSENYFSSLSPLLRWDVFFYLLAIFIMGTTFGLVWGGVNVNYILDLGGSQLMLSIYTALGPLIEVLFFFFVDILISKIGNNRIFYIDFLCQAGLFLASSFIKNAWFLILLEIVNGFVWSTFWSAAVSQSEFIAPSPDVVATLQGINVACLYLGGATGAVVGGAIYQHLGMEWLFRIFAAWSIFGLIVSVLGNWVVSYYSVSFKPFEDGPSSARLLKEMNLVLQ